MEPIIEPVDKALIKAELNDKVFFHNTSRGGNVIYLVDGQNAPNTLREIGRLREIAYRENGGGTGTSIDVDRFDLDPVYCFKQIVLWDPSSEQILGGYRFCLCNLSVFDDEGQPHLPSSHLFRFSKRFLGKEFNDTIELGRSFISPEWQARVGDDRKSIFALENLIEAIFMVMHLFQRKYFFGKVTIYPSYPKEALAVLMAFLEKNNGDYRDRPVATKDPFSIPGYRRLKKLFPSTSYEDNHRILKAKVSEMGVHLPPLINTYLNLFPDIRYFGCTINDEFGDVIEFGMSARFDRVTKDRYKYFPELAEERYQNLKKEILKSWQKAKRDAKKEAKKEAKRKESKRKA